MRRIFTIGETVLDIIFKNGQAVASAVGGAMLNTAVSLGRLGLPVQFISEYGRDEVGKLTDTFLSGNDVATDYVYRYTAGKSAVALAFLDENNNANYTFYKAYPQKRFDITFPEVQANDMVLFGSNYGIATEIRETLWQLLQYAKSCGALIYYDPNFRKPHLHELERLKPAILENMAIADIVRASDEDLQLIFGATNVEQAYEAVRPYCANLIYTCSADAVYLRTPSLNESLPVKKIVPVSTIGAGDTFNAGIAYGLYRQGIGREVLATIDLSVWQSLISYGIDFATETCLSYDNYISKEFAEKYRR